MKNSDHLNTDFIDLSLNLEKSGIFCSENEPASLFFSKISLSNVTAKFFEGNQQVLILTEILKETVYNKLNSSKEPFDLWLQKYSYCIQKFLDTKCTRNDKIICDKNEKYRSINGVCNNFKYPKFGAANSQYGQILESNYADEVHSLRVSDDSCSELPGARQVIYDLFINGGFRKVCKEKCKPNILNVMFGQFITHDTGLRMDVTTGKYFNSNVQ